MIPYILTVTFREKERERGFDERANIYAYTNLKYLHTFICSTRTK